jgi:protein-histidine pros-kinase
LINLTKNALKFTAMGEIKIKATYDTASELLRVSVTDSGKGINPADQDKLFKAFSKLS